MYRTVWRANPSRLLARNLNLKSNNAQLNTFTLKNGIATRNLTTAPMTKRLNKQVPSLTKACFNQFSSFSGTPKIGGTGTTLQRAFARAKLMMPGRAVPPPKTPKPPVTKDGATGKTQDADPKVPPAFSQESTAAPLKDKALAGVPDPNAPVNDPPLTLKSMFWPFDERFEDMGTGAKFWRNMAKDWAAGLVVAMVAIPLAMGFAIASGLKPEQGIVGGAVAGLFGALFGGSKYQVYGPTAAFIPIIAAVTASTQPGGQFHTPGSTPDQMHSQGHGLLVGVSLLSGAILAAMGYFRMGKYVAWVPHSIVVGFTIGLAVTIANTQSHYALGLKTSGGYSTVAAKARLIVDSIPSINYTAFGLAFGCAAFVKACKAISPFIPGAFIAMIGSVGLAKGPLAGAGLVTVSSLYGHLPFGVTFTSPILPAFSPAMMGTICYYTLGIVFVSAVESLLCSRMADRLANNQGTPFNPNRELWGQGAVQACVPLLNGFPHTGALARTGVNIECGAVSPWAGIAKCVLKLGLAANCAPLIEAMPMATISGVMFWVASCMIKPSEIRAVCAQSPYDGAMLAYTGVAVMSTDFLTGVLSACAIHGVRELTIPAKSNDQLAAALLALACVPLSYKFAMDYQAAGGQLEAAKNKVHEDPAGEGLDQ